MNTLAASIVFEEVLRRESSAYGVELSDETVARLSQYYALVQRWNPRLHLVAPCSPEEFATRHVLESLVALRFLSDGGRVIDIGSGAGLPIIPCLIARPDLSATLVEASPKKAVFLREAITQSGVNATVTASRFESIAPPAADFVSCRALERFGSMLPSMIEWAPGDARLLLFGGVAVEAQLQQLGRSFERERMPESDGRYLFVVGPKAG